MPTRTGRGVRADRRSANNRARTNRPETARAAESTRHSAVSSATTALGRPLAQDLGGPPGTTSEDKAVEIATALGVDDDTVEAVEQPPPEPEPAGRAPGSVYRLSRWWG